MSGRLRLGTLAARLHASRQQRCQLTLGQPLLPVRHTVTSVAAQPLAAVTKRPVDDIANELPDVLKPHAPANRIYSPLDFNNAEEAFKPKTSADLLRSWLVFSACQFRPLVKHADDLLDLSKRILGSRLVNFVVKKSFFAHFCAGEDSVTIKPTLRFLHQNGIGGILDYAAEDDMDSDEKPPSREEPHNTVVARTFDYEGEEACDRHMHTFLSAIEAAADAPGQGFAAIKVTALGKPKLLERVSTAVLAMRNLFGQFDEDHNGRITRDEFGKVYSELFTDASEDRINQLFKYIDRDNTGYVDYLSWGKRVRLQDMPQVVQYCRNHGPLYQSALSPQELKLLGNMLRRLDTCAETAAQKNVRLMIDAEHSYFQPAIDHAAIHLMRKYNTQQVTVLNTYQCYLKDSHDRLVMDMDRARREGFFFGAKLVRGAYMVLERERAKELGYDSPINATIDTTHANYDRCIEEVLNRVATDNFEVMVATHNQRSIEWTCQLMHELGLHPSTTGVYFGQLLGMADHLTFTLGRNGYRGYKYVPYGLVEEVMPYLIRRAQENNDIMGGVAKEKIMIRQELFRRIRQDSKLAQLFRRGSTSLQHANAATSAHVGQRASEASISH